MQFTAHCKRKKGVNKTEPLPFPIVPIAGQRPIKGIYTGVSVEIVDNNDKKVIFDHGCYGKGSKSRGAPRLDDESETLVLNLEEAGFLSYILGVLSIVHYDNEEALNWQRFLSNALKVDPNFLLHFAAYHYLKSKNWIVKSGIKFGGHYLIYKHGPKYYHASFLVIVSSPDEIEFYSAKDMKGLQRIAETSDKDVLLLDIIKPPVCVLETPQELQRIRVTETVIRRFNYTGFVQTQNLQNK